MFLVGYMNLRAVSGSSELSVGCGVEASGDEEHAEAVVLDVADPAGDAAAQLDDPVDGLGAAVARAVGIEVGQERCPPSTQGLAQSRNLGDRA